MNLFRFRVSAAVAIAGAYTVVGALWILFSDHVVAWLAPDRTALEHLQTLKGWFFVLTTGGLLYLLIFGRCRRTLCPRRDSGWPRWPWCSWWPWGS